MAKKANISSAHRQSSGQLDHMIAVANLVPWNKNWAEDKQQAGHNIAEYMDLAWQLRPTLLGHIKSLLQHAPDVSFRGDASDREYKVADIDQLLTEIEADNTRRTRYSALKVERTQLAASQDTSVESTQRLQRVDREIDTIEHLGFDNRFLKSEESAHRKLLDPSINQFPEYIGDYLRFQVLCDTAQQAAQLRHALQTENLHMTSQKDRLRRPHTEGGHRAFMYHATASDGRASLKFEGMICLRAIEELSIDKTLRTVERECTQGAQRLAQDPRLGPAFNTMAGWFATMRTAAIYKCCASIPDLDKLLDTDIHPRDILANAESALQGLSGPAATIWEGHFGRVGKRLEENPYTRPYTLQ